MVPLGLHGDRGRGRVVGGLVGLVPAVGSLVTGTTSSFGRHAWNVPYGSFFVTIDPLSAVFVVPILFLCSLSAVFGVGYLREDRETRPGAVWLFSNLLMASMVMVAIARNGILFLVAWEVMSLASYFLVVYDDEKPEVCEAGRTYLIATHLGTAFLLVMFGVMGKAAGSLDFDKIAAVSTFTATTSSVFFLLAVIGFGTKAGFMPLHVWLPDAHPAAPSHVSAVMSGVMVKTGIYGICPHADAPAGAPPVVGLACWSAVGLLSGVCGILYAPGAARPEASAAYSTVENIGDHCHGHRRRPAGGLRRATR